MTKMWKDIGIFMIMLVVAVSIFQFFIFDFKGKITGMIIQEPQQRALEDESQELLKLEIVEETEESKLTENDTSEEL